jgi:hypothetical protein
MRTVKHSAFIEKQDAYARAFPLGDLGSEF